MSDGHGSKKSFRSDQGAQLAVGTAAEVLTEFKDRLGGVRGNLSEVGRAAEVDLPREMVRRWQQGVEAHLIEHPLTDNELRGLESPDRQAVDQNGLVVYGATLLAVLLTPRFALYLQLGDGDIVVVGDDGAASRPLPPDERLFANETLSLCSPGSAGGKRFPGPAGAWSEFRVRFQPMEEKASALVLVSTDGYANAFRTDADFLQVGPDLLQMIREEGIGTVRGNLGEWLADASEKCGDDVTLGIVCRADVTTRSPSSPPAPGDKGSKAPPLDPARTEQVKADGSKESGDDRPAAKQEEKAARSWLWPFGRSR